MQQPEFLTQVIMQMRHFARVKDAIDSDQDDIEGYAADLVWEFKKEQSDAIKLRRSES